MSRDTTDGRAGGAPLPPDDDIAALFEAQSRALPVPPELDESVRLAARAAVADDGPGTMPAPDANAGHARRDTPRHRRPPRWLAAAAVVGLAVALVPFLRQAPEPHEASPISDTSPASSQAGAPAASADDAGTEARKAEHPARTEVAEESEAADGTSPSVPAAEALFEMAPTARRRATSAPVSTDDAVSSDTAEDAGIAARSRTAVAPMAAPADDPFAGYRRTPSTWLERLRERLRVDGLTPALEAEYRRFRTRHPDIEPTFDPAAVVRDAK